MVILLFYFSTSKFSRKHDLIRHAKIHGIEKPYNCPSCLKAFARKDALKAHVHSQGCVSCLVYMKDILSRTDGFSKEQLDIYLQVVKELP
jgi:hypothetical protein